jgi:ketosteroid isomerase-like protein
MTIIEQYWATASAGDWAGFGALLAHDIVYELPQTRERVRGRERYVRFNAEYPAGWRLTIEQSYVDAGGGASWATFTMDGETMPAVTFFRFDPAGLITHVTDFWPEPYDPPAGREHLVERY